MGKLYPVEQSHSPGVGGGGGNLEGRVLVLENDMREMKPLVEQAAINSAQAVELLTTVKRIKHLATHAATLLIGVLISNGAITVHVGKMLLSLFGHS